MADTGIYALIDVLTLVVQDFKPDVYKTTAELCKHYSELPAIADWIKKRPEPKIGG